ncbi:MAG: alpha/beta fold hydrolase [Dehalococcoidia bacterium]
MLLDLTLLMTEDGVQLPAGFFVPTGEKRGTAIDAVVLNPGTSANFWHPTMTGVATAIAAGGYPALTLSTRGHDLAFRDARNNRYLGATYENIADCGYDYTAAIRCLVERGYRRIALYGHSLGSTKATYYAAHGPDPALAALIAVAGPRWSASLYETGAAAEQFRATRRQAEDLVAAGREGDVFEARFPTALPMTAAGWLDKYAGENYNLARWAQGIRVPVLRLDCSLDEGLMIAHMAGQFDDIQRLAPNPHNRHVVLDGVDHFFTKPGSAEKTGRAVVEWLDGLE